MTKHQEPVRIELPTVFGMKTVNSYLFTDPVPTLIDSGENTEASWRAMLTALKSEKLSIRDIKRVIITHAHVDHMGMAARLANESGAVIWVNERSKEWATDIGTLWHHRSTIMRELIEKFFKPEIAKTIKEMMQSMGGKMTSLWPPINPSDIEVYPLKGKIPLGYSEWQILYLPGHSNTQTCFFNEDNGHFISADMLLKITATPVLEEDPDRPGKREKGLLKMLDSYRTIKKLPISKVFPGHYEIFENAGEVIKKQVQRIHSRKDECFEYVSRGQSDIFSLYRSLYGEHWNLPAFNMLIGYIDLLSHEQKITLLPIDDHFRIVAV